MNTNISLRGDEWIEFSESVLRLIEEYTVKQYGDYPYDIVTEEGPDYCRQQIRKYAARLGKNARGPKEELCDCLKIAHYSCMLRGKLKRELEVRDEKM